MKQNLSTNPSGKNQGFLARQFLGLCTWLAKSEMRFATLSLQALASIRKSFFKETEEEEEEEENNTLNTIIGTITLLVLTALSAFISLNLIVISRFAQGILLIVCGEITELSKTIIQEKIVHQTLENPTPTQTEPEIKAYIPEEETLSEEEKELIDLMHFPKDHNKLMLLYQRRLDSYQKDREEQLSKDEIALEKRFDALENLRESLGIREDMLKLEEQKIRLMEMQNQHQNQNQDEETERDRTEKLRQMKLKEEIIAKRRQNWEQSRWDNLD